MVKPYLEPALTTQHENVLGWLSSCASMHLCESCVAEEKCWHFWDAVSAKTSEQVEKGLKYYERIWHGIQESRQPVAYQPPAFHPRNPMIESCLPLPIITREEAA